VDRRCREDQNQKSPQAEDRPQRCATVVDGDGTKLPFDQEMIPCHFWKPGDTVTEKKKALVDFWDKNINRPPIVKMA
jgi:hypothetical protein